MADRLKAWPKTGKDGRTPGGKPLTPKSEPKKDKADASRG